MERYCGRGFALVEVLVALAFLSALGTAVVSVVFGIDEAVFNNEMRTHARAVIFSESMEFSETAFLDTVEYQEINVVDGGYEKSMTTLPVNECVDMKEITVRWGGREESGRALRARPQQTELFSEPCFALPFSFSNWHTPLATESNQTNPISTLDFVYPFTISGSNTEGENLHVLKHALLEIFSTSTLPIFALDATEDFVYVAHNATTSALSVWKLQQDGTLEFKSANDLLEVDPFGSFPQPRTLFLYKDLLFVGTKETAGHELHIFKRLASGDIIEISSLEITHNINGFAVKDETLYMATSADNQEIFVVDISNPNNPNIITTLNLGLQLLADRDATALAISGDSLFVGRKRTIGSNNDFFTLSIASTTAPEIVHEEKLELSQQTHFVSDMFVQSGLVFVATNDPQKSLIIINSKTYEKIELNAGEVYAIDTFADFVVAGGSSFSIFTEEGNDAP